MAEALEAGQEHHAVIEERRVSPAAGKAAEAEPSTDCSPVQREVQTSYSTLRIDLPSARQYFPDETVRYTPA